MRTAEEVVDDTGRDSRGLVHRLLWGAGLAAAYLAGVATLHLALAWFHEPLIVAN